nr:helix-turn-helix transcriptional regulator [uncultured Oscillibacter sp.]
MTTGERMKMRRKELGIPVEYIANSLGVSVATIYRYENGDIEKVPGTVLEPLSKILQVSPAYLMGWGECVLNLAEENTIDCGVLLTKKISEYERLKRTGAPPDEIEKLENECRELSAQGAKLARYAVLSKYFNLLNKDGQEVAVERIKELSEIPKYKK